MAAIGKIRSWGTVLVSVIGLALFAFIAEELVRSTDSLRNDSRQQVGEVLGKKISVQEFQNLLDEYQQVIKMTQGRESLSEEEMNQVKDMVWNSYVQASLIENEATELGLTVTDQELQNVLKEGTNPMLAQTPFINQQTGRFDANQLKKFLADYKQIKANNPQMAEQYETIYRYWTFIEKSLRQQLLAQQAAVGEHALLTDEIAGVVAGQLCRQLLVHPCAHLRHAHTHGSDLFQPLRMQACVVQYPGHDVAALPGGAGIDAPYTGLELAEHQPGFRLRTADHRQAATATAVGGKVLGK